MQSHLHLSGLTREQVHFSCKQRCTTQASLTLSPPICLGPWGRGGKPKGARGPEACPRPRSSICPEYSATCTFVGIAASLLLVGWVQSRLGGGPRQPSSHSLCKLTGTRASGVGHLSSTPQPRLFFGFPANKASRVLCGGLTLGTGPILGGWVGSPALHKETRALPGVGDKGGWPAPACAGSEGQILQAGCPHPLPWSVRGGEVGGDPAGRCDCGVKRPEVAPASCPTSAWAPPQPLRLRRGQKGSLGKAGKHASHGAPMCPYHPFGAGFLEKGRRLTAPASPALCWVVGPPITRPGSCGPQLPSPLQWALCGSFWGLGHLQCPRHRPPQPKCRSIPLGALGTYRGRGFLEKGPLQPPAGPLQGCGTASGPRSKSL